MEHPSQVQLVSYNINNMEVCASAARISTTKGNAVEIFEKAKGNEKNQELIQKVLRSGHKSIIEHVVFTLALKDVSAFVEQFFIECRLASFTVKSRRYVDFGKQGYYIPEDLQAEDRDAYCQYMDALFEAYQVLLENGIPKEDARFLLPYSFHSNFYCTLNARELSHVICDMKYGRGKGIPELQVLAEQILEQVEAVFPSIRCELDDRTAEDGSTRFADTVKVDASVSLIDAGGIGAVSVLNEPSDPAGILRMAWETSHTCAEQMLPLDSLIQADRPRELEQLNYSFAISNITLSGITHMVRHRMQSVLIPSICGIEHSRFVLPDTIKNTAVPFAVYKDVLEQSNDRMKQVCRNEKLRRYHYYYALSGNVMNIMTTMNARELCHFMKLRSCNRAQWEIREIAVAMLKHLRLSFPELFNYFGPSCFMTGQCPEGAMTCGKKSEVANTFLHFI